MEILTTADKRLAVNALADNFRRGEAQADKPIIVIPKMRDGIDQSRLRWQMRGVSEQNTMAVQDLTYIERDGNLYFEWFVSSDFYAVPGLLELVFVGRNADSTITVKYLGSTPLRVYLAEEGDYTPPPDMLEKAAGYVEQAREISQQVKEAVVHAPKIISGTWHIWDMEANAYIDTGVASTEPGPPGPQGGPGPQGEPGRQGIPGRDGKTPVKGVDYDTPEDKKEMLENVSVFTATLLLDRWQKSGNLWTQTANCPGMRAAYDTGAPWTYKTGNAATDAELQAGMNSICAGSVETLEGAIKATVSNKPTCDVPVYLRRVVTE